MIYLITGNDNKMLFHKSPQALIKFASKNNLISYRRLLTEIGSDTKRVKKRIDIVLYSGDF